MTTSILFLLGLFSTAGHAADWAAGSFDQPRVLDLAGFLQPADADLILPVTVVVFRNSLWTKEAVLTRWQRTNEILRPCKIAVRVSEMVETGLPSGIENVYAPRDQEIAGLLPSGVARPVAFFGSGAGIQTYLDEFTADSPRRPLIGTLWIGDVAQTEGYKRRIRTDYEVVAHEIGHLLGVASHVMGGVNNLMSGEPGFGDASVTNDQCLLFRTSIYLNRNH